MIELSSFQIMLFDLTKDDALVLQVLKRPETLEVLKRILRSQDISSSVNNAEWIWRKISRITRIRGVIGGRGFIPGSR